MLYTQKVRGSSPLSPTIRYYVRDCLKSAAGQSLLASAEFAELIDEYIEQCRVENKSPKTLRYYSDILHHILWFVDHKGYPTDPRQIETRHVIHFQQYLRDEVGRWGGEQDSNYQ